MGKSRSIVAWQPTAYNVLRYLFFKFLPGAYIADGLLLTEVFLNKASYISQTIYYLGELLSVFPERGSRPAMYLYFIQYIVLINIAVAHAFLNFLSEK